MSTVIMAPKRPQVPPNGNKSFGQQPRARILSRQVICVFVLALTDMAAIACSLETVGNASRNSSRLWFRAR